MRRSDTAWVLIAKRSVDYEPWYVNNKNQRPASHPIYKNDRWTLWLSKAQMYHTKKEAMAQARKTDRPVRVAIVERKVKRER